MKDIKRITPYLFAAMCIFAGAFHFFEELGSLEPGSPFEDMVSPWEEHTKLIRQALPSDVFIVGYLDEANISGSYANHDSAEFFLTQYGMAPVVLVSGFGREWMIGNFGNTASPELIEPWLDEVLGKYTIQDFGFGIYLIHDIND